MGCDSQGLPQNFLILYVRVELMGSLYQYIGDRPCIYIFWGLCAASSWGIHSAHLVSVKPSFRYWNHSWASGAHTTGWHIWCLKMPFYTSSWWPRPVISMVLQTSANWTNSWWRHVLFYQGSYHPHIFFPFEMEITKWPYTLKNPR